MGDGGVDLRTVGDARRRDDGAHFVAGAVGGEGGDERLEVGHVEEDGVVVEDCAEGVGAGGYGGLEEGLEVVDVLG